MFDIQNYKRLSRGWSGIISDKQRELDRFKTLNNEIEKLNSHKKKLEAHVKLITSYSDVQKKIHLISNTTYNEYKKKRIFFLEEAIDSNLLIAFPQEGFTSKIQLEVSGNTKKVKLELKDRHQHSHSPRLSEGKFAQELIGITSALSVVDCLNNKIFVDEAFAAASPENRERSSRVIAEKIKSGMQFIFISQNAECYNELPRREIELSKDYVTNSVIVKRQEDFKYD